MSFRIAAALSACLENFASWIKSLTVSSLTQTESTPFVRIKKGVIPVITIKKGGKFMDKHDAKEEGSKIERWKSKYWLGIHLSESFLTEVLFTCVASASILSKAVINSPSNFKKSIDESCDWCCVKSVCCGQGNLTIGVIYYLCVLVWRDERESQARLGKIKIKK